MKKNFVFLFIAAALLFASTAFCSDPSWDAVKQFAGSQFQAQWDTLAKDMGVVVGGGNYHQAKALGLVGFDIGIRVPSQKVNPDNLILKQQNTDMLALPWIQIEKGLPMKIDLIVRGASAQGLSMVGYGLKYNALSLAVLNVAAMFTMNSISHDYVKANSTCINVVASVDIPVIKPYVGIGQTSTTVEPGAKATNENPLLSGIKGSATSSTIEAGVNFTLIPLLYIYGGTIVSGGSGYTAGLGLKF